MSVEMKNDMIERSLYKNKAEDYDSLFLHQGETGGTAFTHQAAAVCKKLRDVFDETRYPFSGKTPTEIEMEIGKLMKFSSEGESLDCVLDEMEEPLLKNGIFVSNKKSVAHLHCPPILPAVVAEIIISSFNQSMDSWDQSTAATYLEAEMIKWLTNQFGLPSNADGTFTSGGTQSNYMGLLLARDSFCHAYLGQNVQKNGLPSEFHRLRILCSEDAHFTVKKSASQLGLGEQAVITIKTDHNHRMCVKDLKAKIKELKSQNLLPFALVGTCGTTDFGSIDPLDELAAISKEYELWFHIDAAFGGALILSPTHVNKLKGIEKANSITVDFHKLFYQPISCGAFLVKDQNDFRYIQHHADYLNPADDEEEGILNLVTKSIQTTRRFDALKLFLTLKTVGVKRLGRMIDYTIGLAEYTANYFRSVENIFVLNTRPELNTVIFRYQPSGPLELNVNEVNRIIQQQLLLQQEAVVAKTTVNGEVFLKFTLLNPRTTPTDIQSIGRSVEKIGNNIMNGGNTIDKPKRNR